MPSTPSGKPGPQDPPGTKPFHLHAGWALALASAEHLCWAPWEVAVFPTSRTTEHLFYATGSPSPSSCSQAGKGASDIADAIQVGIWWSLVLSKDEGTDAEDLLGGRREPSQHPPNIPAVLEAFLPPPSGSPCPKQQWGDPHLQAVLVRKDQMFPRGEAPMCCYPSCSHWLQWDRDTLRSTGAQAMVLLPTTTACAASRRCRRCRARFCTNLG